MSKILIIEDEDAICYNIKSVLLLNNYEVETADNGKVGVELAEEILPDLILCDIMMPGYDGYWVLEKIRTHHTLGMTPFIFITAKVEREDLRKGMELGADDYLTKPFKMAELLSAIEVRLKRNMSQKKQIAKQSDEKVYDINKYYLIDTGKTIERIHIGSIECILAEDVYTNVYSKDGKYFTIRKSLNEWEKLLPENYFIRIHRASIINLTQIKSISKSYNQTMIIHMQHYEKSLILSRNYASKLKGKFII
jgi:DNA-binding LytR/AlgR family response regulator